MKAPDILAMCENCDSEHNCRPLNEVAYDGQNWLCTDCYGEGNNPATEWEEAPLAKHFVALKGGDA